MGSGYSKSLSTVRSMLLEHCVVGITQRSGVQPIDETFWHFSLKPVLENHVLRGVFANALGFVYAQSIEEGLLPPGKLRPLSSHLTGLADVINDHRGVKRMSDVNFFDDAPLRGELLVRAYSSAPQGGFTPRGVYSIIDTRRAPTGSSTIAEAAAYCKLPRVALCTKRELTYRLVAFDRHRDWVHPSDSRWNFALTHSYQYQALRDGGNIAAELPPRE